MFCLNTCAFMVKFIVCSIASSVMSISFKMFPERRIISSSTDVFSTKHRSIKSGSSLSELLFLREFYSIRVFR